MQSCGAIVQSSHDAVDYSNLGTPLAIAFRSILIVNFVYNKSWWLRSGRLTAAIVVKILFDTGYVDLVVGEALFLSDLGA